MTFPLGEYLVKKMQHYYHFERDPLVPAKAHIPLPIGAGFDVQLDLTRIESQTMLQFE